MTLTGATRDPCRALPTIPAAADTCPNLMDTQQTDSVVSYPKEPGDSCNGMMAVTKA